MECASATNLSEITLPGDRAYAESITAAPDRTLYVSSPAVGGVCSFKPQSATVEEWSKPGAFHTRSTLGVLVDKKANLLWVCSNDFSSAGIPGSWGSLEIWGGKWDSYSKGTHPSAKFKMPPTGSDGTRSPA